VLAKLRAYAGLGMEACILSGYPNAAEGDLFARHVLPQLDHGPLLPRCGGSVLRTGPEAFASNTTEVNYGQSLGPI
jgi:hypothetical protein